MGARILSFLLGLLLTGVGWAIVDPAGLAGVKLPALELGAFEGHRAFIGWGALALGIVALLSAILPRGGGPKGGKRRGPMIVDFDAAPEPPASETHHGEGVSASAEPAPPPATPPPQPPPRMEAVGGEPFDVLRERFKSLVRAESWSDAAVLARRLSSSATNEDERLIAARDRGDFARTQGAADDAAEAYDMALGHARNLLAGAPNDLTRVEAVAGLLTGVGDVAQDEGRLDAALEAYEEAVAKRRKVAGKQRDGPSLRALSLALERLADAREDRGHRVRALDLYRESFDIAGKLAAKDQKTYGGDLEVTRRRLAELEARLAL